MVSRKRAASTSAPCSSTTPTSRPRVEEASTVSVPAAVGTGAEVPTTSGSKPSFDLLK